MMLSCRQDSSLQESRMAGKALKEESPISYEIYQPSWCLSEYFSLTIITFNICQHCHIFFYIFLIIQLHFLKYSSERTLQTNMFFFFIFILIFSLNLFYYIFFYTRLWYRGFSHSFPLD